MTNPTDFMQYIIPGISILGAAFAAFFFYKNSTSRISAEVIATYKTRVEQLEERVHICEELHRTNLGEIGKLQGILQEKDGRIATLETILQGRNPEMTSFIQNTNDALKSINSRLAQLKDEAITVAEKLRLDTAVIAEKLNTKTL